MDARVHVVLKVEVVEMDLIALDFLISIIFERLIVEEPDCVVVGLLFVRVAYLLDRVFDGRYLDVGVGLSGLDGVFRLSAGGTVNYCGACGVLDMDRTLFASGIRYQCVCTAEVLHGQAALQRYTDDHCNACVLRTVDLGKSCFAQSLSQLCRDVVVISDVDVKPSRCIGVSGFDGYLLDVHKLGNFVVELDVVISPLLGNSARDHLFHIVVPGCFRRTDAVQYGVLVLVCAPVNDAVLNRCGNLVAVGNGLVRVWRDELHHRVSRCAEVGPLASRGIRECSFVGGCGCVRNGLYRCGVCLTKSHTLFLCLIAFADVFCGVAVEIVKAAHVCVCQLGVFRYIIVCGGVLQSDALAAVNIVVGHVGLDLVLLSGFAGRLAVGVLVLDVDFPDVKNGEGRKSVYIVRKLDQRIFCQSQIELLVCIGCCRDGEVYRHISGFPLLQGAVILRVVDVQVMIGEVDALSGLELRQLEDRAVIRIHHQRSAGAVLHAGNALRDVPRCVKFSWLIFLGVIVGVEAHRVFLRHLKRLCLAHAPRGVVVFALSDENSPPGGAFRYVTVCLGGGDQPLRLSSVGRKDHGKGNQQRRNYGKKSSELLMPLNVLHIFPFF